MTLTLEDLDVIVCLPVKTGQSDDTDRRAAKEKPKKGELAVDKGELVQQFGTLLLELQYIQGADRR